MHEYHPAQDKVKEHHRIHGENSPARGDQCSNETKRSCTMNLRQLEEDNEAHQKVSLNPEIKVQGDCERVHERTRGTNEPTMDQHAAPPAKARRKKMLPQKSVAMEAAVSGKRQ